MQSFSLKMKFGLLLLLAAAVNLLTLVFVMLRLGDFEARFSDFHKAGVEIERQTLSVARDTNFVSRLTRSIMLGDNLDKNLEGLDKTIETMQKSFAAMKAAAIEVDDPAQKKKFEGLIVAAQTDTLAFVGDARERMRKLKDVDRTPPTLAAAWAEYQKAATPLANKARESFKALADESNVFLEATRDLTGTSLVAMKRVLVVVQLLATVAIVLFGLYLVNSVVRPLVKAVEVADRVAAGDLTTCVDTHSQDETGRLLTALCKMQGQLTGVVGRLNAMSGKIMQTSQGLAQAVGAAYDHAREQSESASGMAAAIEQMTVSINHMAESAGTSTDTAKAARQTADEAREVVKQAAGELHSISDSVTQASSLVETLNQRSDEISKIVGVIKEIADQTNLLALNAAIEAARAGEQGRGFAVVADEVRKLAERTSQSTQEISSMLASVQQATRQVVAQMTDSTALVTSGTEKAESARAYMDQIGTSASTMVDVVGDMSSSLQEQGQASTLIAQSVERIAQMTEQTTAELERVSLAARELDQMAVEMQGTVSAFKTT